MRFANNGLVAAMEEVDNSPVIDETEAAELAVSVADESSEVQAEGEEIGVTVSQVEDAVQAGEELEDIAEVAAETVEEGEGMDEAVAEMASIAIESIRNRLGIRAQTRLVPATESFGNTNTRVVSTKLVVEKIGETLKRIWAAIKAAALRLRDKLVQFLAKLFNANTMLVKHIEGLKERVRKLPAGQTPKEDVIKAGSVAAAITVGGKADAKTYGEIVAASRKLLGVSNGVMTEAQKMAVGAQQYASRLTEAEAENELIKSMEGTTGRIQSLMGALPKGQFSGDEVKGFDKKDAKVEVFGPFVGRSAIVLEVAEKDGVELFSVSVKGGVAKAAEGVAALKPAEMAEVLGQALDLAKEVDKAKKVQDTVKASAEAMSKAAEGVIKNVDRALGKESAENAEAKKAMAVLKQMVSSSMRATEGLTARVPSLAFSAAKAGADYVSASLRNMGEPKKA